MDETTVFGGEEPQVNAVGSPGEMMDCSADLSPEEQEKRVLDQAMEGVDLRLLNEEQVADLESGDAVRIEQAILAARKSESADDAGRMPGRISLKAIESREEKRGLIEATRMLRDGEVKSLKEALGKVFDFQRVLAPEPVMPNQEDWDGAAGSESDAWSEGQPGVADLEVRLEQLQQAREERRRAYDYEGAENLLTDILEAKLELKEARKGAEVEQGRVADFMTAEDGSRDRVMARFGDWLGDPKNPFNDLLDVEIALAEKRNDPILKSPDWPENIASRTMRKHEALLGGGVADPGLGQGGYETPPAPRRGVRMPGSPVGGGANSMALTASAALSEFERLSPEEQKGVLEQLDKNRL